MTALNNHQVVLFNAIEGIVNDEVYDKYSYDIGRLVAQIHAATLRITTPLAKENFQGNLDTELEKLIATLQQKNDSSDITSILLNAKERILHGAERIRTYQNQLSVSQVPLVVSHGDLSLGNLLITPSKKIYIIDWDDVGLAPREKDFMFFVNKNYHDFLKGYKSIIPEVSVSKEILKYYQIKWTLDEILFFAQRLLYNNPNYQQRQYDIEQLQRARDELVLD